MPSRLPPTNGNLLRWVLGRTHTRNVQQTMLDYCRSTDTITDAFRKMYDELIFLVPGTTEEGREHNKRELRDILVLFKKYEIQAREASESYELMVKELSCVARKNLDVFRLSNALCALHEEMCRLYVEVDDLGASLFLRM